MDLKLPIIALALGLSACAAEQQPAPLGPQPLQAVGAPLSPAQIQSEIVGRTGVGTRTGTRAVWSVYVSPDGRFSAKTPATTDTGTWRIAPDGRFCVTMKVEDRGREDCYTVSRVGATIQLADADTVQNLVFTPGNQL